MATKSRKSHENPEFPKRIKEGSAEVTIYRQRNPSRRRNPDTGAWELTGKVFDEYVLAYYQGSREAMDKKTGETVQLPKLVREKFGNLKDAEIKADSVVRNLANLQGEALKLTNIEALTYVEAATELRKWNPEAKLTRIVSDHIRLMKRLPANVSPDEILNYYLSRHPEGLPKRTVREAVDELILAKNNAGVSEPYAKELRLRLGQFADAFAVPISMVSSKQIQDWLTNRNVSGRTQNNYRRLISTLFKFSVRRGYLPKDHDEIGGVERIKDSGGEIEIFTPEELRKLLGACMTTVKERKKWRDREAMIPYLAIAAFCGLRSAEIARLDWSEVHLTGPEHFIEVKAAKAKTKSRRTVPIPDNCASWLAPFVSKSGPVCPFERPDKQCFQYLGPAAKVEWKHNALRHSFISYRVAITKNVHQVSLEAGNSPQMVFGHYRQLVTDTQAAEWFGIVAPKDWKNIVPMAPVAAPDVRMSEPVKTAMAAARE